MSRETETACWAAQDCRLDPNCADYGYQCAATAAREVEIRAEERSKTAEQIAHRIRAELVCCQVYQDSEYLRAEGEASAELLDAIIRDESICYWGEAAALIAEDARNHRGATT